MNTDIVVAMDQIWSLAWLTILVLTMVGAVRIALMKLRNYPWYWAIEAVTAFHYMVIIPIVKDAELDSVEKSIINFLIWATMLFFILFHMRLVYKLWDRPVKANHNG